MLFITKEEEISLDLPYQSLYFYASWMPYHKKFLTMIGKIEEKRKGIIFNAIDVEQFPSQCKRFDITSVPSVIILKEGKEIKRITGLVLTSAFKSAYGDI